MGLLLALALALLVSAPTARAQVISGTVLAAESRAPLAGAVVTLLSRDSAQLVQLRADSAGAFSLTLPGAGAYRLSAAQIGYRAAVSPALSIGPADTLQVEFSISRDLVVLKPLVVTARSRRLTEAARRFYERARIAATGSFITRDEIDKAQPMMVTDLFNRLPGIRTRAMMGGNDVAIRGNCRPTVFLDGVRVNGYRSIDDLVQPLEVEGLEIYRGGYQAPAEFGGMQAGCAVILIWTRIQ